MASDVLDVDDEEILFKSENVSPLKDPPLAFLSPTRDRLDTVLERRRTLERSFDYGRGSAVNNEDIIDSIPYLLQVNYTDTQLSHRFIRFEVPESISYDPFKKTVDEYLSKKL